MEGDWTMDIRTKSHNGEPTYNVSIGRAGKGKRHVFANNYSQTGMISQISIATDISGQTVGKVPFEY